MRGRRPRRRRRARTGRRRPACLRPRPRIARALAWQKGGGSSGAPGWASAAATAAFTFGTTCGTDAPARSVSNFLPVQYQRWSTLCPLIITAARSLPDTATLRLAGQRAFISSPSVGTSRWTRRHRVMRRDLPGTRLVLGAIDGLVGPRERLVGPGIGDDPGARRVIAGEDGRMAGAGLGRGVALIAVAERRPAAEPGKAAGEVRAIFVPQIGRELVDRDDDEEPGRRRRRRCGWDRRGTSRGGGEMNLRMALRHSAAKQGSRPLR